MIHDPRSRDRKAELREKRDLKRLAGLEPIRRGAVEDVDAFAVEVREVVVGVEDRRRAAALPRRGRHAVEDQGGTRAVARLRRIESMLPGIDADVGKLAPVELIEEGTEPLRVFVVN